MDPIKRTITDWRLFAERVSNPFDREELIRYISGIGEELAFTVRRGYRRWAGTAEVAWLDGNNLFLTANVEFGSNRERMGAISEMYSLQPKISVLFTSDTILTKFSDLIESVKRISGPETIIIDVKNRKYETVRKR